PEERVAMYQNYLRQRPHSPFATNIRREISDLQSNAQRLRDATNAAQRMVARQNESLAAAQETARAAQNEAARAWLSARAVEDARAAEHSVPTVHGGTAATLTD